MYTFKTFSTVFERVTYGGLNGADRIPAIGYMQMSGS